MRPLGSNADEWNLFVLENKDATEFLAVQIAEAIDEAERRGQPPCGECHLRPGETCDICGRKNRLTN